MNRCVWGQACLGLLWLMGGTGLVACGDETETFDWEVSFPLSLPIDRGLCNASALELENQLRVTLRIGGHEDCPLDLNGQDRKVSGTCSSITVGLVRPLAVVWELLPPDGASPAPPVAQLAYHVGYVDLNRDKLTGGQTEVQVNLTNDGQHDVLIHHPDQLALIPDESASESTLSELEKALSWLEVTMEQDDKPLLNRDGGAGDVCPNLVEACAGTLYEDNVETVASQCLNP